MAKTQAWKNTRQRKRRAKTRKRKKLREQGGVVAQDVSEDMSQMAGIAEREEEEQRKRITKLLDLTPWKKR